ncbi:MAG: hypothetical protein WC220_14595 [Pedobacter sp.]|jgi:hypothetical protein
MNGVYVPDSYRMNQQRLHGESTNLLDANVLLHYTTHARINREEKDKLMNDVMDRVTQSLINIEKNHISTHLPDDDQVIQGCWKVVTGMPSPELRKLISRMDSLSNADPQKGSPDSKKIHAVLEFLK